MRPLLILGVLCFTFFTAIGAGVAQTEGDEDFSSLPEQVILKLIHVPKGLTCRIVAKQKIFDGNYKVYYITILPDGTEKLESLNLLQVAQNDWVVGEAG